MKLSKYICAATSTGTIDLIDPLDLRIAKTLSTSNIGIYSMDAQNNSLVTCGWVNRPQSGPMLAGLANVYDLRGMRQLPPVPFHAGAAFVQLHPRMSTTCIIASQSGQLQVIDFVNPSAVTLKQINISTYMTSMVLAPTGEALAVADAEGHIQLWGSPTKLQFCEYTNQALEWPDTAEAPTFVDIDRDEA
jgi:PAB-dependent poly(A)-specific ribonuclease subunit 2